MKIVNCRLIAMMALLALTSACGGGGGSAEPTDATGGDDVTINETDAFVAASSAVLANTIADGVVRALGVDASASLAGKASPVDAMSCAFLNSTSACTDGGEVTIVGYCMPVDDTRHIDLAAIFNGCAVGDTTMDGRYEVTIVLSAPSADSLVFDMYILGDQMNVDDPGASISDGVNPDIYITSIESLVTLDPEGINAELFQGASVIGGAVRNCSYDPANPDSFACTSSGPPVPPAPSCESDEYVCTEDAAGHEQCHGLMAELGIAPFWMHSYQTNCLNGCCDDGLPRDNVCWGTRECAAHEDCRFPNFAMACIDGFCQGLCSKNGDLRCRHGAVCSLDTDLGRYYSDYYYGTMYEGVPYYNDYFYDNFSTTRYELIDTNLLTLPAPDDYGVCVCPQTDWEAVDNASCGNGVWEPDEGELCDPKAPEGMDGCGAGLRCYEYTCHRCVEADCQDGIDNDGNGKADAEDFECIGAEGTIEGWCADGSANPCCIHDAAWCGDNPQSPDCYVSFDIHAAGCPGPPDVSSCLETDTFYNCQLKWCRDHPSSPCCSFKYAPLDCLCSDGIDNNRDGLPDCQDTYCNYWAPICTTIEYCVGFNHPDEPWEDDEDGDGLVNCEDPDCYVNYPEICLCGNRSPCYNDNYEGTETTALDPGVIDGWILEGCTDPAAVGGPVCECLNGRIGDGAFCNPLDEEPPGWYTSQFRGCCSTP